MPCYQINLISVEFQAKHIDILEKAAKLLKWRFSYNEAKNTAYVQGMPLYLDEGRVEIASFQQSDLNKLKKAYSVEAVKEAAKRQKWIIKVRAANKIQLQRY